MQCEDNAKLRIPLSEVCQTTDIGCVTLTNGKPSCNPQPDELPLAFDPSSTTLWLFSCATREWLPFQKFELDQLASMNLDNIRNICEVLNIAVWYDSNSSHVQGTVTLAQLAEEIFNCIRLNTRTLIIQNNTLKVWTEGLDSLPPYFIRGNNIWFEGGSGTESDPLRIATHDPICEWPTKSQAQVDAANIKHLGACIDGQMSRVPFPPKVCELPSKSEAQVKASLDKSLIACVDGEGAKVPYPKEPCEFPALSREQVDASSNKSIIACVDDQAVKIPYIESDPPLCDLPLYTVSQVSSAGENATMAVCLNGESGRMTVPSGMFVPEYLCVPKVSSRPVSPPDFGTGPLRMGCNSELYVWLCSENRWEGVIPDHNVFKPLDPQDVANIDENLRIAAWYPAGSDDCAQNVYVTINQLFELLGGNEAMREVIEIIASDVSNICKFPVTTNDKIATASVPLCVDGSNVKTSVSNFGNALTGNTNFVNTITNSVTNSENFSTKVTEIIKDSVTDNVSNITNVITQEVVDTGNVQKPICSLATVDAAAITSAGANAKVAMCVSGESKQATVSSVATSIANNSNFINTITGNSTFTTKVNDIVKDNITNNTGNISTLISDAVANSGKVQNPICSLNDTTKDSIKTNWGSTTVPVCENNTSKKVSINDFYNALISNYTPPEPELDCDFPFKTQNYNVIGAGGISSTTNRTIGRLLNFSDITLEPLGNTGVNAAVYRSSGVGTSSTSGWDKGSGVMTSPVDTENIDNGVGQVPIVLKNDSSACKAYVEINTSVLLTMPRIIDLQDRDFSVIIFARPALVSHQDYYGNIGLTPGDPQTVGNFWNQHAVTGYHATDKQILSGSWDINEPQTEYSVLSQRSTNILPTVLELAKERTVTYYLQFFVMFTSKTLTSIPSFNGGYYGASASVKVYRGVYI